MSQLLPNLVSAGQFQIFTEYLAQKPHFQSLGGVLLADIHQHPNTASSCGPDFPAQLKHGLVTSFRGEGGGESRFATGMEHLGAQGFHLFGATTANRPFSKMLPVFQRFHQGEQKCLSGNGMHLGPLSAWLLYVLGNVVRTDIASGEAISASACSGDIGDVLD